MPAAESMNDGMPCEERSRLLVEFDRSVLAYSEAVEKLKTHAGIVPVSEYQRLKRAVESHRLGCEQARLALENHRLLHDCQFTVAPVTKSSKDAIISH
jgi:hypothetical protein